MIKFITLHKRIKDWKESTMYYTAWLDTYGAPVTIDVNTISSFTDYKVAFKNDTVLDVAEKHDEIFKIIQECR